MRLHPSVSVFSRLFDCFECRVKRGDQVLLTVPVNLGIVGGLVGLAAAPWWGVLAAAAAAYGFDCKFEIIKDDGSSTDVM